MGNYQLSVNSLVTSNDTVAAEKLFIACNIHSPLLSQDGLQLAATIATVITLRSKMV